MTSTASGYEYAISVYNVCSEVDDDLIEMILVDENNDVLTLDKAKALAKKLTEENNRFTKTNGRPCDRLYTVLFRVVPPWQEVQY